MWEAACDPGTRKFTAAGDVFMFGLTMWETLSRGRALLGEGVARSEVAARLRGGERPPRLPEAQCPEPVAKLLAQCLDAAPARRPSMEEVAEALKELYVRARAKQDYAAGWETAQREMREAREEVAFGIRRVLERADAAAQ
jgi:hypothetical protein